MNLSDPLVLGALAIAAFLLFRRWQANKAVIATAPATLIVPADPNMFSALSGGGPEATAIVKDAHLRFGLKRNLREHYEATKHLMDDPAPTPPAVPNSPPAP